MLTLLLVEDPQVYLDLQKRLGPRGVKVINIASGTVALEMIRNLKPALVILGYDLQDLPGKEVYRRLKKNPQSRSIPVIILCDPARGQDDLTGFEGDEVLSKDVSPDVLVQKISEKINMPLRRHDRIAIDMGVRAAQEKASITGFARNISASGVFIETNDAPKIGSDLTLSFTLPGQQKPLVVPGKVVRCIELQREFRFGLGIQFSGLPPGSREQLLDFLIHKSLQVTA